MFLFGKVLSGLFRIVHFESAFFRTSLRSILSELSSATTKFQSSLFASRKMPGDCMREVMEYFFRFPPVPDAFTCTVSLRRFEVKADIFSAIFPATVSAVALFISSSPPRPMNCSSKFSGISRHPEIIGVAVYPVDDEHCSCYEKEL